MHNDPGTEITRPSSDRPDRGPFSSQLVRETGGATIGALIGLAIGGPTGAVIGAATGPAAAATLSVVERVIERRKERANRATHTALAIAGLSVDEAADRLQRDADVADQFVSLLEQAARSEAGIEDVLGRIMGEVLSTASATDRDRLMILADAVRGLRSVHLRILNALSASGGVLAASDLASNVGIPEVELRGAVRDLETRGMIKDLGRHPVEWKLRALGRGLLGFVTRGTA